MVSKTEAPSLSWCPCRCGTYDVTVGDSGYLRVIGGVRIKRIPSTRKDITRYSVTLFREGCGEGEKMSSGYTWDPDSAMSLAKKYVQAL
jgi:hypothetical protein